MNVLETCLLSYYISGQISFICRLQCALYLIGSLHMAWPASARKVSCHVYLSIFNDDTFQQMRIKILAYWQQ